MDQENRNPAVKPQENTVEFLQKTGVLQDITNKANNENAGVAKRGRGRPKKSQVSPAIYKSNIQPDQTEKDLNNEFMTGKKPQCLGVLESNLTDSKPKFELTSNTKVTNINHSNNVKDLGEHHDTTGQISVVQPIQKHLQISKFPFDYEKNPEENKFQSLEKEKIQQFNHIEMVKSQPLE